MCTSRVKLFTHYVGELPSYVYDFVGRVRDISIVDWELLLYRSVEQLNRRVAERLAAPCCKADGYAMSDVRPMWASVFPNSVQGYEWWGWCELDVVLGDLDNLLPPLLHRFDAISAFPTAVSGPLMLLRNNVECNDLFRRGSWEAVLREPSYCNFEEVQREEGGFTRILRSSNLRVHWDDRYSLRWEKDPAEPIPAGCRLEDGRLLEVPTERELLLYHFNHVKRWPMPC